MINNADNVLFKFFNNKVKINAITLIITENCNLRCSYCYTDEWKSKLFSKMDIDIAKKAIDYLFENSDEDEISITFSGGEPLLEYKFIEEIINYCEGKRFLEEKKVKYLFITNGTLINDDVINLVKKYNIKLAISIDGTDQNQCKHRKYDDGSCAVDDIIESMKRIIREDINFSVRITVTKQNLDLCSTVLNLINIGVKNIRIMPVASSNEDEYYSFTKEELSKFYDEMDKIIDLYIENRNFNLYPFLFYLNKIKKTPDIYDGLMCKSGLRSVVINPLGQVYSCCMLVGEDIFKLGDLNKGQIDKKIVFHQSFIEKCKRCDYAPYCTNACYARFHKHTGDMFSPDDVFCTLSKYYIDKGLKLLRKGE